MIKIRDAKIEDATKLAAAERTIAQIPGLLASQPHELEDEAFKKKIEALSKIENGKYIVAEENEQIVGHALLDPMALESIEHVNRLTIAVHSGFQGKGIGEKMLAYLIDWARSAPKVEKLELNVRSVNPRAIRLYEKMGFQLEGRIRNRMRFPDGTYVDDLVMGLFVKPIPTTAASEKSSPRTAEQARELSQRIMESKFPGAVAAFCAGSIVRGEGTETSDIDLVVVFPKLEKAWRESFIFEGWPVEAFVHDPATLQYFFEEVDAKSGVPSLPQMVREGLFVYGDEKTAQELKALAGKVIDAGPALLVSEDIKNRLYGITDLVDDLRAPKSRAEAVGIAAKLYEQLADFALRSQGHWSGAGKQISRSLRRQNPELHSEFVQAFDSFFAFNDSSGVVKLAEKITTAFGGLVFDGYRREAPASWRKFNARFNSCV
jgi:RimJ/RimL family protein N-acetyltransferase